MSHSDFDVVTGPSMAQRRASSVPQQTSGSAGANFVTPSQFVTQKSRRSEVGISTQSERPSQDSEAGA
jgi:hypothetical protein